MFVFFPGLDLSREIHVLCSNGIGGCGFVFHALFFVPDLFEGRLFLLLGSFQSYFCGTFCVAGSGEGGPCFLLAEKALRQFRNVSWKGS